MKRPISLIFLALIVSACADPDAIGQRAADWEGAFNAGDVDALAEFYTEDARLMAPNTPTTVGRDAVKAAFSSLIDAGLTTELQTSQIEIAGGVGHRVGSFSLNDGDNVIDKGKFIETWVRDADGAWRISADIWNSDMPAMPPHEPKHERKRERMEHSHVMIMHDVADGEHWLNAWRGEGSRHDLFEANGAKHVHTFQHPDNPNLTGLVVAVEDLDALQAMIDSEEGQAAAAEDGVDMESLQVLMEVK